TKTNAAKPPPRRRSSAQLIEERYKGKVTRYLRKEDTFYTHLDIRQWTSTPSKDNKSESKKATEKLGETGLLYVDNAKRQRDEKEFEGLIIVTTLVCSIIRSCRRPTTKLIGLEILKGFGVYLNDHVRLDRLIPYVRSIIHDDSQKRINEEHSVVVAKALEVITVVLQQVVQVPPKYAGYFLDYISDTIIKLISERKENEEIIRIEIAQQLSKLATTAKYFLDYRDKDRQ
ncbi:serine/threonine-protein kinase, partial [Reticulomyxa filosa]